MIAALRWLLLAAYPPLAHFAGARHSPLLATLALGDLALMLLIGGLLRPRASAWLALIATGAALAWLAHSSYALLPLLLVPPAFAAMVAIWFARSLRPGRVPLITRVVAALYRQTLEELSPRHHHYARNLTAAWALLLAAITSLNLALALIATPDGILARLGIAAPLTVTGEQWSLIANVANYGLLGGFALIEFQVRKFVFPVRPYRNAIEFARQMAALGPGFWRDFFRGA